LVGGVPSSKLNLGGGGSGGSPTPTRCPQQGTGAQGHPHAGVQGGPGGPRPPPGYSLSPEELHPQKGEDDDEEEEEEEEADDGLHGVQEGDHQVPQGSPVPARAEPGWGAAGGPGTQGR